MHWGYSVKSQRSVDSSAAKLLPPWPEDSLRQIAVDVRDFDKEIRDGLLSAIGSKDRRVGEMVTELMIIWADIPYVTDIALQKVLKGFDVEKLALALHDADDASSYLLNLGLTDSHDRSTFKLREQ